MCLNLLEITGRAMDRINEVSGEYDKVSYTNIKCKNFDVCGNFIRKDRIEECHQANGDYLCEECFHELDKKEMGKD